LANGRAEIPDSVFPSPPKAGQWSLEEGRLYLDGETVPFRAGLDEEPPVVRCEIPELAERWGLASVAVRLEHESGRLYLIVEARAVRRPGDAAAEAKAERDRLSSRQNKLVALLRKWQKLRSSEQGDQIRDEMLTLMEVRLPAVPHKPNREDPKYKDVQRDPQKAAEFEKAMRAHEQAAAEKAKLQGRVEELAKAKNAEWSDAIKKLDKEITQARRESTGDNDRAVEELTAKCQGISAVIHPVVDRRDAIPPIPAAPPGEAPMPPAAASSGLPVIAGSLRVQADPSANSDNSQRVRLKLQVFFEASAKPPKWLVESCAISCTVRFHRRSGHEEIKPADDVSRNDWVEVPSDTQQIDLRFDFFARERDSRDEPPPRIATSESFPVMKPRLEGARQYLVRFEIPKEGLEQLRDALSRAKPVKTHR